MRLFLCGLLVILLAGCQTTALSPEQRRQQARVASELPAPGQPVFHVIGVHQGRWPFDRLSPETCRDITEPKCVRQMRHLNEHRVQVHITDRSRPIILGLSAYERTHWRIKTAPGVRIARIILSGVHPQWLTGVDPEVPVERYQGEAGFFDYLAPAREYEALVAQPPTSFAGAWEAGYFLLEEDRVGMREGAAE